MAGIVSASRSHATLRVRTTTEDGREAWIVPTEDAGEFRREVVSIDPWTALEAMAAIDREEKIAADKHAEVWETTGWRREGRSGYEPTTSHCRLDFADAIDEPEMEAWRAFQRAQSSMPVFCRGLVFNMVAWHVWPPDVRAARIGLRVLARFYGVVSA